MCHYRWLQNNFLPLLGFETFSNVVANYIIHGKGDKNVAPNLCYFPVWFCYHLHLFTLHLLLIKQKYCPKSCQLNSVYTQNKWCLVTDCSKNWLLFV